MHDQLVGLKCTYRPLFAVTPKEGVVTKITALYSIGGQKYEAEIDNGDRIELSRVYFFSPIAEAND